MNQNMEKTYIINNCKSFEPKDIFECGQCFRWDVQDDESYTGIFGENVFNVKKEENNIIISGICKGDIKQVCDDYFDMNRDYESIKETLSKVDDYLNESIKYGSGIRILNQDLWEMIISFITSANNNIPRIKGIINRLSKKYGKKIEFRGKDYYTFPTVEALSKATIQDLRNIGLGFRDKYIYNTTQMIYNKEINLEDIQKQSSTRSMRKVLLELQGIGPKVADCILLFSTLKRLDVFPVDVWVRRVMNELYIKNPDENKVTRKEIENIAEEKFGELEGIAQQYLFYWKRDKE